MPKAVFAKINYKEGIENAVLRAMKLADWKKYVKGKKMFLKINSMGNQLVPGLNTSPFVLESALKIIREEYPDAEISMGDANLATVKQLEHAAQLWGYYDLAKKYNCRFVNLSEEKIVEKEFNGKIFQKIYLPEIIANSDCIVSIPILKTHGLTKITCSLKNSWGFLPRYRHQYHPVVDKAIAEMNSAIKVDFVIVDATVCMDGKGPRTGKSKICDAIICGNDRVAVDTVAARFAGISDVAHITESESLGVGTSQNIVLVGDEFSVNKFEPPKQNIVFFWEMRLRKIPIIKQLFFGPLFNLFAWVVTQYNTKWWYNTVGRKEREKILNHEFYGQLYKRLEN